MASILNKREKAAKRLLKSGHASMKDILTLSFGEWPPKGLDINPAVPHAQQITFKPFFRRAVADSKKSGGFFTKLGNILFRPFRVLGEMLGVNGQATLSRDRVIWINKLMLSFLPRFMGRSSVVPTLGHEAIHNLQGDNYYRAAEIYGQKEARKIRRELNGLASDNVLNDLKAYDRQFSQKNSLRRKFNSFVNGQGHLAYLKTGSETQAFFHEALAAGYKKWGKLPQDQTELWRALISMGLKPPKDIKAVLKALPADAPARGFSKRVRGEPAFNLRTVNNSLGDEGRRRFWYTTMPGLYSDLIEMYGDRKGRERFGFGTNTTAQRQARVFGNG